MAYNTGNPIGSTDARDLSDNAQDFDQAVNGPSSTWVDRLGNTRTSLRGQVGYTGTGTGGAIQSYTSGLVLSGYNVIILYSGEFYRPSASATLPYTTTATLPDVDSNLVSIGDANLRQDLADSASGSGASLVSMEGGPTVEDAVLDRVIRVTSIAAMEAYSAPVGYVFSLNAGGRSGVFDVIAGDFSTELAADTLNGIYVGLADNPTATTKVAKRQEPGIVSPLMFGAVGDGIADDTIFVQAALDNSLAIDGQNKSYRLTGQVGFRQNTFYTGKRLSVENATFVLDYSAYPVFTSASSIGNESSDLNLYSGNITFNACTFTQLSQSTALNLSRMYNVVVTKCTIAGLHLFGEAAFPVGSFAYSQSLYVSKCNVSDCGTVLSGGFVKAPTYYNLNILENFFERNKGHIVDAATSGSPIRIENNVMEDGGIVLELNSCVGVIKNNYFEGNNLGQEEYEGFIPEIKIFESFQNTRANLEISGNRFTAREEQANSAQYVPVYCHDSAYGDIWAISFHNNVMATASTRAINERPLIVTKSGRLSNYHTNNTAIIRVRDDDLFNNRNYFVEGYKYRKALPVNFIPNTITTVRILLRGTGKLAISVSLFSTGSVNTANLNLLVSGNLPQANVQEVSRYESFAGAIAFGTVNMVGEVLEIQVDNKVGSGFNGLVDVTGVGDTGGAEFSFHAVRDEQDLTFITFVTP